MIARPFIKPNTMLRMSICLCQAVLLVVAPVFTGMQTRVAQAASLNNSQSPVAVHFVLSNIPQYTTVGTPFQIVVTAMDANNRNVTSYNGTVHFTSTDRNALLPENMKTMGTVLFVTDIQHRIINISINMGNSCILDH